MNTISIKHSGNIGDIHAAAPAMKSIYEKTGKKVVLYLNKNDRAEYYEGSNHPTKNEDGEFVKLNQQMIDMVIPLYKEQPYIENVKVWEGEHIDYDFDWIRETYVGMPAFSIQRWYFYVFPDTVCDLSKGWFTVPASKKNFAKDKILINRTERYQNPAIDYSFLKDFEDDCLFIGTVREWNSFCMNYDLNIEKVNVSNFLEYAQAVQQSRFYISNQSQGFQIAEAIQHPRILELCNFAPNVIINGANGYDYFSQYGLEYYVNLLVGEDNLKRYFDRLRAEQAQKNPLIEAGN